MTQAAIPPRRGPRRWASILRESAKILVGVLSVTLMIVVSGIIVQRYVDVPGLRGFVESFGVLAPVIGLALLTLHSMLFLPFLPWPLVIGTASVIFGNFRGALYVWLGTAIGACLAFVLARRYVGVRTSRLEDGRLKRLQDAASAHGLLATIGFRLLLYSNAFLNYGVALTPIKLRDLALGTFIGLLPRSFLFSYLFESVHEPDVLMAQLEFPFLSLHVLLILCRIAGGTLLFLLARQELWPRGEATSAPVR